MKKRKSETLIGAPSPSVMMFWLCKKARGRSGVRKAQSNVDRWMGGGLDRWVDKQDRWREAEMVPRFYQDNIP